MQVEVQLTYAPIPSEVPPPAPATGAGAWVEFRGLVRSQENGRAITALEYEAYEPMAEREVRRLLNELGARYGCLAARVIHRIGVVPVGQAALYVGIAAEHRAEAFKLLTEFMYRLKQDVPIWKRRAIPAAEIGGVSPHPWVGVSMPGVDRGPGEPARPADVLGLLRRLCGQLEAERLPLAQAIGRVLREPVCAPEDLPPFDRAAVDGYAVRLDDPSTEFRVVDVIRAGAWQPRKLDRGEAVRIATGAALPCEGLQVLMKEDVQTTGDTIRVNRRTADRNIRTRGEDARAGQRLVEPGSVVTPGVAALLAGLGRVEVWVTRLPRVRHIATGNEIVPPAQAPAPGQIRDSNSILVRAFLGQWGIVPQQTLLGDDDAALRAALRNLEPGLDLLLISGGASVGEQDFTRRLLDEAGFVVHVSKTAARPGRPLIVAQRGSTLAFGLPGNPLAHLVCLNVYVRAALQAWSGSTASDDFHRGVLAGELATDRSQQETFWPARSDCAEGTWMLRPLPWRSSGDLTVLARANALIRVPTGAHRFVPGSWVEFVPARPAL